MATAVAAPSAGGPPATEKQYQTIQRFERTLRIPKDQRANPDGLTRAQASEIISDYIAQMNPDPDDEQETQQRVAQAVTQPTPPTQREAAAQQVQRDRAEQTIARVEQQTGTPVARAFPPRQPEQGEWPPAPPQSSERQPRPETITITKGDVGEMPAEMLLQSRQTAQQEVQRIPQPSASRPATGERAAPGDDPFEASADESWEELGATPLGAEDDEIDLERAKLAPVAQNLGFVVISADKKAPGQSGYAGILITAKHIAGTAARDEAEAAELGGEAELGGTATEFLSLSPNARWVGPR